MAVAQGRRGRAPWRLLSALIFIATLALVIWQRIDRGALPTTSIPVASTGSTEPMVLIPAGRFLMGNDFAGSRAARPQHEVELGAFWMDACEVTVAQFAEFVAATGYVTTAERAGGGQVFDLAGHQWRFTQGAFWRCPLGPHSAVVGHETWPVVQVSWSDATAYARWAKKRLPTEAEWEYAARGGRFGADYPWGHQQQPDGQYAANYWQGWFPDQDLGSDGFRGPAPIGCFAPNRFGLYDMAGNVWEWCADWYVADSYEVSTTRDPRGPTQGTDRVQRGGSWLSADNDGPGLRVWTRQHQPPESSHNHVGFRCVREAR